ncbi:MAG TPA: LysR family transcriptional regulator [Rhizobiales bacterium]|nr:LysR family transcriptional regulator [Hyphomicrobiales bacterium]
MSYAPRVNILFEMLYSFTTLARTLNLSKAVRILNSTRQTVRRHIDTLEEFRGEKLFEIVDRQYSLTPAGLQSLEEAEKLLAQGNAWLAGHISTFNKLDNVNLVDEDADLCYYSQQHHISQLWIDKSPLLQFGLRCWASSNTSIESPGLAPIRPYLMICRRQNGRWVYTEIGEKSSYASWFGWVWAKSCVGCPITDTPDGMDLVYFSQAYSEAYAGSGVRLDHIYTEIPREKDGPRSVACYQRLVLGCSFPNGEFALAVLVDRTHNISINGLPDQREKMMPESLLMSFTPPLVETSD